MASFTAQIQAFTNKTNRKMLAVFRESVQRLAEKANTVGPSVANPDANQGGKMPVDTGFLRNSILGSSGSMPKGMTFGSPEGRYTSPIGEPYQLALLRTQLGDKFYIGWTAAYAIQMEVKYGYMRSAAQNWNYIVREVVAEVVARTK